MSVEDGGKDWGVFRVHASLPEDWASANLWAWYAPNGGNAFELWPGCAMEREERGRFYCDVPGWANSIIISGNGGRVQTEPLNVSGCELWINVNDDLKCDVSCLCPDTVKVCAYLPSDWVSPSIWAWSSETGRNADEKWPGSEMHKESGFYSADIPVWADRLVISIGGGEIQTGDMTIEPGRDVWIEMGENGCSLSYEKPEPGEETAPAENTRSVQQTDLPEEPEPEKMAPSEKEPEAEKIPEPEAAPEPKREKLQEEAPAYSKPGKKHSLGGIAILVAAVAIGAVLLLRKKRKK